MIRGKVKTFYYAGGNETHVAFVRIRDKVHEGVMKDAAGKTVPVRKVEPETVGPMDVLGPYLPPLPAPPARVTITYRGYSRPNGWVGFCRVVIKRS